MKSKPYKYVHTINDKLGHYYPGEQICHAVETRPVPMVASLRQIRRGQQASKRWRTSQGFENQSVYGWLKIATN